MAHATEQGLDDALDQVMDAVRRKYRELQASQPAHTQMWVALQGFVHAIDWREPFVAGLVAAQLGALLLTIATRKHTTAQSWIFGLAVVLVYFGERINGWARQHWQAFTRQDYFDERGVFYGTMVSGPLLIDMFIILINYLLLCTSLMIKAKRLELKHKARQQHRLAVNGAEGVSKTGAPLTPGHQPGGTGCGSAATGPGPGKKDD